MYHIGLSYVDKELGKIDKDVYRISGVKSAPPAGGELELLDKPSAEE